MDFISSSYMLFYNREEKDKRHEVKIILVQYAILLVSLLSESVYCLEKRIWSLISSNSFFLCTNHSPVLDVLPSAAISMTNGKEKSTYFDINLEIEFTSIIDTVERFNYLQIIELPLWNMSIICF